MYRKGNICFKTKEAKEIWILENTILSLNYIGKESKLSKTEKELKKLVIKDIKAIIKTKIK